MSKEFPQHPPRRPGRKPTGLKGEAVSTYKPMTVRLPVEDRLLIDVLSRVKGRPGWRIIVEAVRAYESMLPASERRMIQQLLARKS